MSQPTLTLRREGPLVRVTMARPESRNAFNPAMIAELTQAFTDLTAAATEDDPSGEGPRVVLLSGEGRVFSAGADLEWMRSMAGYALEDNLADATRLAALFRAIRDCPLPVLARVQGAAMGGGSGLVAACDIAVAAEGTVFAFSEARLGIVPAVISPFVLPKIGSGAARELFLTGERFDARRALAIGLINRVVPESELDAAIAERLSALLAAAPGAQSAIKRLIPYVASEGDSPASRAFTARLIADRRASREGQEGMAAFLERRPPSWAASEGSA